MAKDEQHKVVKVKAYSGGAKCQMDGTRRAAHEVTLSSGSVIFICTPCLTSLPKANR
jgi:hypothetical protein